MPERPETVTSFIANAELKELGGGDLSVLVGLADERGLCGEGLGGEPGIFSARWAGEDKDFGMARRLVHEAMERAGPDAGHDAHFICALSLAWPDGHIESFEGRVDGLIVWPPRGTKG